MAPGELRVVVDTMVQGLGRYLRSCGVDVVILHHTDDHMKAVQIAKEQGRIVLTGGAPYEMVGSCMESSMLCSSHFFAYKLFLYVV